jgi:thiamine-phosphate pyrophosphorylase
MQTLISAATTAIPGVSKNCKENCSACRATTRSTGRARRWRRAQTTSPSAYTPPRPSPRQCSPLSLFAEARALGVPLVAIGGITLENAPPLLATGADALAVVSDLFDAPDIAARARAYGKLFRT